MTVLEFEAGISYWMSTTLSQTTHLVMEGVITLLLLLLLLLLNLRTPHNRTFHFDALIFISVSSG